MATAIHKGSLRRTLLSGTVTTSVMLMVCSFFAPAFTELARRTGGMVPGVREIYEQIISVKEGL